MKLTVPTHVLLDAVGHAASVAATKSPKPILECVALRADPTTGLGLEATDLDVGVRLHVADAEVSEGGGLAVPAARLLSVLREVEDETVTVVGADGAVRVDSGGSHFRIRSEDLEGFADLPRFPKAVAVTVPGGPLRAMIRRTVFATAKEAGRYALHGVLFRIHGDQLELVATDGRRLARIVRGLGAKSPRDMKVIVGPKGLSLLDRVMGPDPQDVGVALEERQVLFRVGGAVVISRLIDGTFPAYEDVIPKHASNAFVLGASDFATALRKASLLTTRDSLSVQFEIEPQMLTIRSRAPEVGEARVEVPIAYEGPSTKLGFNPIFLSDALKVMEPEHEVRFEFTDGKAPGKLTDEDDYVYVVMPVALE
jgi:DNA polymerase III subunit beta